MTVTDEQPRTHVRLPVDDFHTEPRRRPPWFSGIGALAVVALVMGALAFVDRGGPATSAPGPTGTPHAVSADRGMPQALPASRLVREIPVGYEQTPEGVQSAAGNYVDLLGSEAMLNPETRHAIVDTIAAPDVKAELQERFDAALEQVVSSFDLDANGRPPKGTTFVYRTVPLGVRLVSYEDDTATVEVWTNGIIGLAGDDSTRPIASVYNTVTPTMRWVDGDWKWVSFTQKDGPTPVTGIQPASPADQMADAVTSFEGFRYAR